MNAAAAETATGGGYAPVIDEVAAAVQGVLAFACTSTPGDRDAPEGEVYDLSRADGDRPLTKLVAALDRLLAFRLKKKKSSGMFQHAGVDDYFGFLQSVKGAANARQAFKQAESLPKAKTKRGKARAWIPIALFYKILTPSLVAVAPNCKEWYEPNSIFHNKEMVDFVAGVLAPLELVNFQQDSEHTLQYLQQTDFDNLATTEPESSDPPTESESINEVPDAVVEAAQLQRAELRPLDVKQTQKLLQQREGEVEQQHVEIASLRKELDQLRQAQSRGSGGNWQARCLALESELEGANERLQAAEETIAVQNAAELDLRLQQMEAHATQQARERELLELARATSQELAAARRECELLRPAADELTAAQERLRDTAAKCARLHTDADVLASDKAALESCVVQLRKGIEHLQSTEHDLQKGDQQLILQQHTHEETARLKQDVEKKNTQMIPCAELEAQPQPHQPEEGTLWERLTESERLRGELSLRCADLEADAQRVAEQLQALRLQVAAAECEKSAAQNQQHGEKQQDQQSPRETVDHALDLAVARASYEAAADQVNALQHRNTELQQELGSLAPCKQILQRVQAAHDELKAKCEQLPALQARSEAQAAMIASLQNGTVQLTGALDRAQAELQHVREQMKSLSTDNYKLSTALEEKEKQVAQLRESVAHAAAQGDSDKEHERELARLKAALEAKSAEVARWREQFTDAANELAQTTMELGSLSETLKEKDKTISELHEEAAVQSRLQSMVHSLEHSVQVLRAEADAKAKSEAELQEQLRQGTTEAQRLRDEAHAAQESRSAVERETVASLQRQLEQRCAELAALREQANSCETQLSDCRADALQRKQQLVAGLRELLDKCGQLRAVSGGCRSGAAAAAAELQQATAFTATQLVDRLRRERFTTAQLEAATLSMRERLREREERALQQEAALRDAKELAETYNITCQSLVRQHEEFVRSVDNARKTTTVRKI
eukprot:TRINITY_DN2664_c0_g1_i12.p1 TRINITY_DN2664_c0_g1~~TRINITY_DN2664_c0_g1_i12.p1  ORF type:complete len:969 (-),score=325.49 TRINITY_DN2664_c0_g1_i12:1259-4165(-)